MSYSAKAIANYFLSLAKKKRLNPLKLQKLIYFAHGWHLAIFDKALVNETVEAWEFGPVIDSIYEEFKEFGKEPINRPAFEFEEPVGLYPPRIFETNTKTTSLLRKIWNAYGKFTGIQLSNMTHEDETPWKRIYDEHEGDLPLHKDISDLEIKNYFSKIGSPKF